MTALSSATLTLEECSILKVLKVSALLRAGCSTFFSTFKVLKLLKFIALIRDVIVALC